MGPHSLIYICIRCAQLLFCLIVLGLAGSLLSEYKKSESAASTALSSLSFGSGSSSFGDFSSALSGLGAGSTSSGSSDTDFANKLVDEALKSATKPVLSARDLNIRRRSPKRGGGGGGGRSRGSSSSSGSYSPKKYMKYTVPLGLLISVSVFTLLSTIASIAIILLAPSWSTIAFLVLVGWDAFLTILWIAAVGTTGTFNSQYEIWDSNYKGAKKFKACFAFAFIMMLSFFGTTFLAFILGGKKALEKILNRNTAATAEQSNNPELAEPKSHELDQQQHYPQPAYQ